MARILIEFPSRETLNAFVAGLQYRKPTEITIVDLTDEWVLLEESDKQEEATYEFSELEVVVFKHSGVNL